MFRVCRGVHMLYLTHLISFVSTPPTCSALARQARGEDVVVPKGRKVRFPEQLQVQLVEKVKQAGYTSQSLTLPQFVALAQQLEQDHARQHSKNPYVIKSDHAACLKIIANRLKLTESTSAQAKRRTEALSDHRNSVAAAVMERVVLFDDPVRQTGQRPAKSVFNLDATSVRLTTEGTQKIKLVSHAEVKKEMQRHNRSTTRTGEAKASYYRLTLYLTTSASGRVVTPIFVCFNQTQEEEPYRIEVMCK